MHRAKVLTLAFLCSALLVAPATVLGEQYRFDTVHTQILFFVDHLGFSKSQGEFLRFDGGFDFQPSNISKSMAKVTIYTDSVDMDDEKWNKRMKGTDYFHVEKFPTIEFSSTQVTPTGDKEFAIHGDLTMLGETHPIVIKAKLNKVGVHPKSGNRIAGFSAGASLLRSRWGMKRAVPFIGDEVEIRIEVEGIFQR